MILKKDYILKDDWKTESITAMDMLNKYISKEKIEMLKQEIALGNFDLVSKELMENYYDPMYNFKSDKLSYAGKFKAETNSDEISMEILQWHKDCL